MPTRLVRCCAALALISALAACGADNPLATPTAPQITTQPEDQSVEAGAAATFQVAVTGTTPLTYQWSENGTVIAGATAASYTTAATTLEDNATTFQVTVTNTAGSVMSNLVTLTVTPDPVAPSITTPPANQAVTVGQTATFGVVATGTAPLTYQWQENGVAIAGATASSYTTPATASTDNGSSFVVVVSNSVGSATSAAATLTVTTATLAPSITTQPVSQSVTVGQTATFSVAATGTAPLSYQWQENGTPISGATSASYTTPATASGDAGSTFAVVVTNATGSVTSSSATLTVTAVATAPQVTTPPASESVTAGQTASFSVVATGTAPLSYQWQLNGTAIAGATGASYTTPSTTTANSGSVYAVVVSNTAGSVTSGGATLVVTAPAAAPSITSPPASQTVNAGQTATFSVTAAGTAPLTYQWQQNGAAISGATGSSYTTPATTSANNGATFSVVVTNSAGSVTSSAATLTVDSRPQITAQPASTSVTAGQTASFSVVATGTAPLSYQWRLNGSAISGATASTYTTPATTTGNSGSLYTVVVTNAQGSVTSNAATLTVTAAPVAPTISTPPASQTVTAGQTATFSVVAAGTAPLTYQWRLNGSAIPGATGSSYTTPVTTTANSGAQYSVLVTNATGSATSSAATLTVNAAPVAPTITTQPASASVTAGQTATFSVVATGTAPLTYQWRLNGSAISGATGASYTTPATTTANNGSTYLVVVSNSAGSATSSSATLTVTPAPTAPSITSQPASASVTAGQTATFSVVATGTAPLSYQWQKNGSAISGATGSSYTTPATTTANNGSTYLVVVSNSAGSATSNSATLTVTPAPTAPSITTQPASQTVTAGQTATFSVVASGTAPLTYQWQKNGSAISGATASSYTTPVTTTANSGTTYLVVVTNSAGSATSSSATLTVTAPPTAPSITTQPSSQTVTAGQTATFSVVASGTAPLTYQWQLNGNAISGATGSSYTTPVTTTANSGSTYLVVVTNSAGSATSNSATLTVNPAPTAPSITTQPANQSVTVGQTATFSVAATGTAPLSYQWSRNGTTISGATSNVYTTPATVSGDNGSTFTVAVTNSVGSVTSSAATLTVTALSAGTDVVTYKNDLARTGQNLTETILTPTNVNSTSFGLLRNLMVDGLVDAQPLYLSRLTVGASAHNVVFVATEHDSVYAFDSDTGAILWQVSLIGTGETTSDNRGCTQVTPEIGITATPVIDRSAGAHGVIYVVAMTKDSSSAYHQRLHALDVTTGVELVNSPTEISATYASTSFAPGQYKERAALLLSNGTIYTSWASHCDDGPYGGWVIAFSQSSLQQTAVINLAPDASGSGYANQGPSIWMSGGGPAADAAGNVYVLMANGKFDTTLNGSGFPSAGDFGNSFVKLTLSGSMLVVSDYFAMDNEVSESSGDTDLGSGGAMLLPDVTDSGGTVRQLVVGAGKDSNLYVVNRAAMGEFNASSNNIWQELDGVNGGAIFSTPAYFNSGVYYGSVGGTLKLFTLANARLSATPASQTSHQFGYPGTFPVISASGTANAIVWASENSSPAVLHAYSAGNLATELYNSSQAPGNRDQFGSGNKYIVPTVADGKVFVGTTNSVAVFGLL